MPRKPRTDLLSQQVVDCKHGHVYGGSGKDTPDENKLDPLLPLVGRWFSPDGSNFGYNVMPLPQVEDATAPTDNIILKNFHYFEHMDFGFVGRVPNRGGTFTQNCYGLLYEQRVTISDGPDAGKGIHAENGSWLRLLTEDQFVGPYGNVDPNLSGTDHLDHPPAPDAIPTQSPSRTIAKQVSVPHGNSLLAIGTYEEIPGKPRIPDVSTLPVGAPPSVLRRYHESGREEDINPNVLLQRTLDETKEEIEKTVVIRVSTDNGGHIGNIPFMRGHADVCLFETTFWIEHLREGGYQLQYTQTINIEFPAVAGRIVFPHVTVNTLRRH